MKAILIYLYLIIAAYLAYLGWYREPLPYLDRDQSCWFSIGFIFVNYLLLVGVAKMNIISFPSIYYMMSTAFLAVLFPLYLLLGEDMFLVWFIDDVGYFEESVVLILLGFCSLFLGILLFPVRKQRPESSAPLKGVKSTRLTGYFFVLLAFGIIGLDTLQGGGLALMFKGGYSDFYFSTINNNRLLGASFVWFIPWGSIFLVASSNTKRDFRNALFFVLPAMAIVLLVGDRGTLVQMFLAIVLFMSIRGWLDFRRLIKVRNVIGLFMLLFLLQAVRTTRQVPIQNWTLATFIESDESSEHSFLVNAFLETSISIQSIGGTLKIVPQKESYRYGYDYVKPFINAIPFGGLLFGFNFSKKTSGITPSPTAWFTFHYNKYSDVGYGYLQLMEAYLQFDSLGILFVFGFFGFFLHFLWYKLSTASQIDSRQMSIILIFITTMFLAIRNDSGGLVRVVVFNSIILYLITPWIVAVFNQFVKTKP